MQRGNTLHRVTTQNTSSASVEESALALLGFSSQADLQELQDNEEKLDGLINDLPQVKQMGPDKEMLITSNKSLAEYNLSMEPVLRQGREYLIVQYENATKLKEEYDTLRSVLDSKSARQSLDTTHALLQTKAAQSEEETDRLSETFLDKQMECDEFLERYMEERSKTHLLKIKSEKLGEMIQHHTNSSTWGGSTVVPPRAQTHHGGYATQNQRSNIPPYPMYNTAMPQANLPPVSN